MITLSGVAGGEASGGNPLPRGAGLEGASTYFIQTFKKHDFCINFL